jgi:hypothetical protein
MKSGRSARPPLALIRGLLRLSSPLKNGVVAFFNLAKRREKLVAARKSATLVTVLASRLHAMTQPFDFFNGC